MSIFGFDNKIFKISKSLFLMRLAILFATILKKYLINEIFIELASISNFGWVNKSSMVSTSLFLIRLHKTLFKKNKMKKLHLS